MRLYGVEVRGELDEPGVLGFGNGCIRGRWDVERCGLLRDFPVARNKSPIFRWQWTVA